MSDINNGLSDLVILLPGQSRELEVEGEGKKTFHNTGLGYVYIRLVGGKVPSAEARKSKGRRGR